MQARKLSLLIVVIISSFIDDDKSAFVGAMDMDWKDREKSQDQDS